jgi:hypothetical protein
MAIKPKAGDKYDFNFIKEDMAWFKLPRGTLVYVPAPRPTSKREKKGVSG